MCKLREKLLFAIMKRKQNQHNLRIVSFALHLNIFCLYGDVSFDDRIIKKMRFNLIYGILSGKALLEARASRVIMGFFDQLDWRKFRPFPYLKYKNQIFMNKIMGHSLVLNSFRSDLLASRFDAYQARINKKYNMEHEFYMNKSRQKKLIQLFLDRCNIIYSLVHL